MTPAMPKKPQPEQYTPEQIEQRALEMVRRSFTLPHKTAKDFKGTTPRAKAMARKRKTTGPRVP